MAAVKSIPLYSITAVYTGLEWVTLTATKYMKAVDQLKLIMIAAAANNAASGCFESVSMRPYLDSAAVCDGVAFLNLDQTSAQQVQSETAFCINGIKHVTPSQWRAIQL